MTTKAALAPVNVPPAESQGARLPRDLDIWQDLESLLHQNQHTFQHVLELFPVYVRRLHLGRFLAHYELFKQVIDLPGCIVELGVYRGVSFFTWAKLMEIFCPGDRKRKVFGFDNFQGFAEFHEKDGKPNRDYSKVLSGYSPAAVLEEVQELTRITNRDTFVPESERGRLVIGDVRETIPAFLKDNPGLRISLLHLDVDLYEPTKVALEQLYPLVVKGGVVVFDEYGLIPWEGESCAVDEYFGTMDNQPLIKKFPFTTQPHGYLVK